MIKKEILFLNCCLNQGEKQCRYLGKIENKEYVCLKKTKNKKIIDSTIKETKNKSNFLPIADNCPGIDLEIFSL